MRESPHRKIAFLLLFALMLACSSCVPPIWNADVQTFVEDGLSTVTIRSFTAVNGGQIETIVPSGSQTVATLNLINPRSVGIACTASCADETLFDSLPAATVESPTRVALAFTPSLSAERKDLVLTLGFSAPSLKKTYPPQEITIHCNTRPGSVEASLDAALDASGYAFAAFRLPSAATDSDLSRVRITYSRADGTGSATTVTPDVGDASLLTTIKTAAGTNILGAVNSLNRYYEPSGITSGDDYEFTVVVVDSEGLESAPSSITSNATLYSVTYDGNGNDGGAVPVDSNGYRQTKTVTVLGAGSLSRTGFFLKAWNTKADGSGTSYAAGNTFAMGASNVVLYAQWGASAQVTVGFSTPSYGTVVFYSGGSPVSSLSVAQSATPLVLGYSDKSATVTVSSWAWYLDGAPTGATTSTYSLDISTPGRYVVSCTAVSASDGVKYAGSLAVTVTGPLTVSYDGNGATSGAVPASATYTAGQTVAVSGNTGSLGRSGYSWLGWATDPTATIAQYTGGDSFIMGAASLTLYAVWAGDSTTPSPVAGVTATTAATSVTLSWTDPTDGDLAGIRIDYSGGGTGSVIVAPGVQTATITGLTSLSAYTFTLYAFDVAGHYSSAMSITATPGG